MPKRPLAWKLPTALGRLLRGLLCLGAVLVAACGGGPDGLVIVQVQGLVPSITELYVTMQLDGAVAKNPHPQSPTDTGGFHVYDDMQRFGVVVPSGTLVLGLNVVGHNTNLEVVKSGAGMFSLNQGKEFTLQLTVPGQ